MIYVLLIANLIVTSLAAAYFVDYVRKVKETAIITRHIRDELKGFKAEILHHINHLTVRKRPAERHREQRGN